MNTRGNGKMGRVLVEFNISNYEDVLKAQAGTLAPEKVRQVRLQGIADTGATRLVLPEATVKQLGLPTAGQTKVGYADQRSVSRPVVRNACVQLLGREGVFTAVVEPDRKDALLGAIVLEDLDFVVECTTQTLRPRDPDQIITEVE